MVSKSMVGYVLSVDEVAVIVFRGTDDSNDWIANMNRFVAKTEHGPAHRGFCIAYQPLASQVSQIIGDANPKHIWITGHSLGGALAVLCAYELIEYEGLEIDGLVTFGQPMVARDQLCDHLNEILAGRFVHYVNQSDVVPRIPPSFEHCGSLVWYVGDEIRRSKVKPQRAGAQLYGDTKATAYNEELEPLSDVEFEQLQAELKADDSGPDYAPDGTPLVKGNLPFIKDHDIGLYREAVASH